MIGKGKSIAHTLESMRYGMNEEKNSEIVYREFLSGETASDITEEFRVIQSQNENCIKNTLSFVLSPTIEDGKQLSNKQLKELTQKFMKQMKLNDRQAIAFVHRNREHTHVHLYVNRIDFGGKAYNDSFIGKRSQMAAEKVAKEMGLTTVREVQQERLNEMTQTRIKIRQVHEEVIKERPRNLDSYIKGMNERGVTPKPYINNQGKLQGFRFEYKGESLKGSEVHRKMSISNIGKVINFDSESLKKIKEKNIIQLANKSVSLSPNLAMAIIKRSLKIAMKASRDVGIGI